LPGHYTETTVPRIEVADGVGAILIGSMAVGCNPSPELRFPIFRSPALRITDEESLIAGEAVSRAILPAV
jgi:hypothetical protein